MTDAKRNDKTTVDATAIDGTAMNGTAMNGTAMDDTATDDRATNGRDTAKHAALGDTSVDTEPTHPEPTHPEPTATDPTNPVVPAQVTPVERPTGKTGRADRAVPARQTPAERPTTAAPAATPTTTAQRAELLPANDVDQYQTDWRAVQSGFVDDPAGAVRDADALVGRLVDTITSRIAEQRSALSARKSHGNANQAEKAEGDDTERLRQALRDYRTMFQQLLPAQRS